MGTYTDVKDQFAPHGSQDPGKDFHIIQDMELKEEWQDEEFPRPLPEDTQSPGDEPDSPTGEEGKPAPPSSLALSGTRHGKRRLVAPALSLTLDRANSTVSDEFATATLSPSPDEDFDINLEDLETPSDSESWTFPESTHDLEWEDDLPRAGRREGAAASGAAAAASTPVMEQAEEGQLDLDEVDSRGRKWRVFRTAGQEHRVDMSVLEPYLRVLSHGGYYSEGQNDIIVFSSCYLPENSVDSYEYVMENLYRYIIGTLDLMVSENYIIVYLNGMSPRSKMPPLRWLRQCYQTIDRRLKKNLKGLLVVHPSWYIRALITVFKPFISAKFTRKLRFMSSLHELAEYIPMDHVEIPDCIRQLDEELHRPRGSWD
ncbi:bcl-2/adenovirus E1B 19 kDa-interacting protein 2-like protein isoform X1 [Lepisosteus oculatus]|uniref:bcl-2/adenovirus E1B 19 kDa-interacting protein 2-like protein isoform X1 n=2 Tax=Lepisosteus oculatus TaxID=7918 RepID=UPI0037244DB9